MMKLPSHKTIFIALLVFFCSLYLLTARGITFCNDGSQMALVRSIAEEGSFAINAFVDYTKKVDFAFKEGNYFSDRPIGTSLLSVPAYKATHLFFSLIGASPTYAAAQAELAAVSFLVLYGALGVAFLYLLLITLTIPAAASFITALVYGSASLHWKYSALFMAHAPCATTVIIILWLIFKEHPARTASLLFFLMGALPLIRYEAVLLLPFLFPLWLRRSEGRWYALGFPTLRLAFASLTCLATPLMFLAYYHTACFGSPFEHYAAYYAPDRNFFGTNPIFEKIGGGFSYRDILFHPVLIGLQKVLFQFPGHNDYTPAQQAVVGHGAWGIFILHPVLLLSLFGCIRCIKTLPFVGAILCASLCATIYFTASLWIQDGGGMRDPRFVMMAFPIFYIFLAYAIEWFCTRLSPEALFLSALFWITTSASFLLTAIHFIDSDERIPSFTFQSIKAESLISSEFLQALLRNVFIMKFGFHETLLVVAIVIIISTLLVRIIKNLPLEVIGTAALLLCALLSGKIYFIMQHHPSRLEGRTIAISNHPASIAAQEEGFPQRITGVSSNSLHTCKSHIKVEPRSLIRIPLSGKEREFSTWVKVLRKPHALNAQRPRLRFIIRVNNTIQWSSVRTYRGTYYQLAVLPLHNAQSLTLEVISHGGPRTVWGVWCNPQLLPAPRAW